MMPPQALQSLSHARAGSPHQFLGLFFVLVQIGRGGQFLLRHTKLLSCVALEVRMRGRERSFAQM